MVNKLERTTAVIYFWRTLIPTSKNYGKSSYTPGSKACNTGPISSGQAPIVNK